MTIEEKLRLEEREKNNKEELEFLKKLCWNNWRDEVLNRIARLEIRSKNGSPT